MKKMLVSVVAAASLAIPIGWVTAASATPQPDPDANGDLHSNCHTGSKFRGAGGEDGGPGNPKHTSDNGCVWFSVVCSSRRPSLSLSRHRLFGASAILVRPPSESLQNNAAGGEGPGRYGSTRTSSPR